MNRADLALLAVAAIWGTTFALLRDSIRILHPVDLMAIRFTMAAIVLAILYGRRVWPITGRAWLDGTHIGLWLGAGYLAQVVGLATITASRSAFITGTYVAFVPIVALALVKMRPRFSEYVGIGLILAGLYAFSADAGFSFTPGDLWTLGCSFTFGVQIVITNIMVKRSDAMALSIVQIVAAAAMGWIIVGARGGIGTPWSEMPWGTLVYLAVAATALVIALQTWALGRTSPIKATLIFSLEPVFAALFAGLFFGERMTGREYLGGALILTGVIASELLGRLARGPERTQPTAP
ncbi:MAG TPA: DMT family transporter [Candidatus Eisenbacteria bacterium]|nr:DMT family transporter [Candidatus Eisenbacteria bacterium]